MSSSRCHEDRSPERSVEERTAGTRWCGGEASSAGRRLGRIHPRLGYLLLPVAAPSDGPAATREAGPVGSESKATAQNAKKLVNIGLREPEPSVPDRPESDHERRPRGKADRCWSFGRHRSDEPLGYSE